MRWIILLAFMLASPIALAQNSLILHTFSYHAQRDTRHNEQNFGLSLKLDDCGIVHHCIFGTYDNSQWNQSFYAAKLWRLTKRSNDFRIEAGFGPVSGYKQVKVLAFLNFDFVGPFSPMLTYAPTQDGGVVLLSFRCALNAPDR